MSDLEKQFPGKVKAENVSARDAEAQKVIKEEGFQTHGLLILDANDKVVFKQPDHKVKMDKVRAEIRKRLKS